MKRNDPRYGLTPSMNAGTLTLLQKLDDLEWFVSVGRADLSDVVYVNSWLDATASCISQKWASVHLEANNLLANRVFARSQPQYNQWNQVVDDVKPAVIELVRHKTAPFVETHKLPKEFWWSVGADLIGAAMECEYSELVQTGFFTAPILECYIKGHFPCGWEGEFPVGRLIVY